jgi:hypothetical protein
MRIWKNLFLLGAIGAVCLVLTTVGCGQSRKDLTPTVAKQLVQEYLGKGSAWPNGDLTETNPRMSRYAAQSVATDYSQGPFPPGSFEDEMRRLIEAGFIKRTVSGNSFSYELTPKLLQLIVSGNIVRIGKLNVVAVDDLLLDDTNHAHGRITVRPEFNEYWRATDTGWVPPYDFGNTAMFQKKVDGDWTCVSTQ